MKKIFLSIVLLGLLFSSCEKTSSCSYTESTTVATAAEVTAIESYLSSASITNATKHPSGFYYVITTAGTGATASLCSQVEVFYTGKLTNGTVFDKTTTQSAIFTLGQLISGWQKGLPLIKAGGSVKLIIPPSLGYGSVDVKDNFGKVIIPGNSLLVFDMQLVSVR
jgi:FKBP-type peptidyl-prolyl cis-trans isomerase FkpA